MDDKTKHAGILATLGALSIGLIISLLAVEGLIRVAGKFQTKTTWTDRPAAYYKAESSKTLQDYAYSEQKDPNKFRIAVVGDSFTFAPYMQFDDAFPKRLERMLNLNDTPLKAEVLNLGVPGFSTDHEATLVQRISKTGIDLLLLQITLNDPQLKPYTPTGLTGQNQFGAAQHSSFQKKLYSNWKTLGFIMNRVHNAKTHRAYKDYYFDLFENPKTWNNFEKSLQRIARITKKRAVPVAVMVFPLFGLPVDDNYPFYPLHTKVHQELNELQIPFIDLTATFKGIPLPRIQVEPGKDFHPNEIGHRLAAEATYDWLDEQQMLPEEIRIRQRFANRTDIRPEKSAPLESLESSS